MVFFFFEGFQIARSEGGGGNKNYFFFHIILKIFWFHFLSYKIYKNLAYIVSLIIFYLLVNPMQVTFFFKNHLKEKALASAGPEFHRTAAMFKILNWCKIWNCFVTAANFVV
jgi:hypothetical protein